MALSEQEQRLLEEMERSLYQNDADVMSTTPRGGSMVSAKSILIIVLAAVIGLGLVVVGMASSLPWVGLIGFIVMVAGVIWALSGSNRAAGEADTASPTASSGGSARGRQSSGDGSFMSRFEDRWERRRDGDL